ncbi:MAG: hypothetical protein OXB88_04590 [Bacteriovoracales bacterium]|nr:hypothetical protein [Bacteriovoracales bacterium]
MWALLPFIFYLTALYMVLNWALTSPSPFRFSFSEGRSGRAKHLLDQLVDLIARHAQWQIRVSSEELAFPRYKFYTALLQTILQYSMQWGAPISGHLKNMRKCLIKDWEFEQKLSTHLISTLGQIVTFVAVTWGFGLFCRWVLKLWPERGDVFLVAGLQGAGALSFYLFYQKRKIALFRPYESCYHTLISAAILGQLGMPLGEVIERCAPERLPRKGKLAVIARRLEELFGQCHHRGHSMVDSLYELRDELDFYMEEDFKAFLRFTKSIKFLTLALFYFPAYLIFVFSLFGGLFPK